jgi:hypothetical protein
MNETEEKVILALEGTANQMVPYGVIQLIC